MPQADSAAGSRDWADAVYEVFEHLRLRQVCYVPDAGHARLIRRCADSAAMRALVLTTEEEGIALLAGAWLGGERGALLLQSSGVGNCINMLAMTRECRFPLLMLVTQRGQYGEFNPWQVPMGQSTASALQGAGALVYQPVADGEVAEVVAAAASQAYHTARAAAVLISQRIVGIKHFDTGAGP